MVCEVGRVCVEGEGWWSVEVGIVVCGGGGVVVYGGGDSGVWRGRGGGDWRGVEVVCAVEGRVVGGRACGDV